MHRFEDFEQRISRMEYEAELAYTARTANADFKDLEHNADIAATLDEIRARIDKTANV
jgi:phage shock protein A